MQHCSTINYGNALNKIFKGFLKSHQFLNIKIAIFNYLHSPLACKESSNLCMNPVFSTFSNHKHSASPSVNTSEDHLQKPNIFQSQCEKFSPIIICLQLTSNTSNQQHFLLSVPLLQSSDVPLEDYMKR